MNGFIEISAKQINQFTESNKLIQCIKWVDSLSWIYETTFL